MKIDIQSQGFELPRQERERIAERLQGALARFRHRLIGATVHLRDVNGPRGGPDKNCRILLQSHDGTTVVHDRGLQAVEVFERALQRALHAIRRRTHRREGDVVVSHRNPRQGGRNRRLSRAMAPLLPDTA